MEINKVNSLNSVFTRNMLRHFIEYKSVMHKTGYKLAIFALNLFECIGTDI